MDKIKGGKSDNIQLSYFVKKCGKEVFLKELELGIKTELEHTDDVYLVKEIALDHLFESCRYYSSLLKMEKSMNESFTLDNELEEFGLFGDLSCSNSGILYKNDVSVGSCDFQLLKAKDRYYIYIANIEIDPKFRGKGYFNMFLEQISNMADRHKLDITLEPSSIYGSDKDRLVDGYRKFGFIPYRGQLSGEMIRKYRK